MLSHFFQTRPDGVVVTAARGPDVVLELFSVEFEVLVSPYIKAFDILYSLYKGVGLWI